MSETEQISDEELARQNAAAYLAQKAEAGTDSQPRPTMEQIKSTQDTRAVGTKAIDGAVAFWEAEEKGRLGLLIAEGGVEAAATAFTIIGDAGAELVYDWWAPTANSAASHLFGDNAWQLPLRDDGFLAFTAAVQNKIKFVEPTKVWLEDENGVPYRNPLADAEWLAKGFGSATIDLASFIGTAGTSGAILGVAKNSRILKSLTGGTKSLQYVKNIERVEDGIELLKKSDSKLAKADKKLAKAGDEYGKAADVIDKSGDVKIKPGSKDPYDTVGEVSDGTINRAKTHVDKAKKLEGKADDLKGKAKGHREHTDDMGEGKRTRSILEDGYEKVNKKLGGEAQNPITRAHMEQYVGEVVTTGSPKGLRRIKHGADKTISLTPSQTVKNASSKLLDTPAKRIRKLDERIEKLGDQADDVARRKELRQTRDDVFKKADDELEKTPSSARKKELERMKEKATEGYEKEIKKLDDTAMQRQELLTKRDKAVGALQKELDEGVNKLADRLGFEKFTAEDALKYADKVDRVSATGLRGAFESAHTGFYRGMRFADPFANPWMEVFGFSFAASMEYMGGKAAAEAEEKEGKDIASGNYKETVKDNQGGHEITEKTSLKGKYNLSGSEGSLDDKDGKNTKAPHFNGVSSGNTILNQKSDPEPAENTKSLDQLIQFNMPSAN